MKPAEFADQMSLNVRNCWGILKAIVDLCFKHPGTEGRFALVRDPMKPMMGLYYIAPGQPLQRQTMEPVQESDNDSEADH